MTKLIYKVRIETTYDNYELFFTSLTKAVKFEDKVKHKKIYSNEDLIETHIIPEILF